jgi:hypothetical protein
LHHALETSGRLEDSALSIRVLGVDKLGNHATGRSQVVNILRDLENKRVGIAREMGVALLVGHIASLVPLGSEKCIKLVVLDVDDNLLPRVVFLVELANSSHCLARPSWDADRVHDIVVLLRYAENGWNSL